MAEDIKDELVEFIRTNTPNVKFEPSAHLVLIDPSKREKIDRARSIKQKDFNNHIVEVIANSSVIEEGFIKVSYETVSKNLKDYDYDISYTGGGDIDEINYNTPSGTITKTFNYTGSDLTSIVLSGATPTGIKLTKSFTYSGGDLVAVIYS